MSTKTTYALRALIHLARYSNGHPESLGLVAERESIPLPYLEQIFLKLKKGGLVKAVRGPEGGFQLAKVPDQISLEDIITVLEGPIQPALCSFPEKKSESCHETGDCLSRKVCCELDGAILSTLKRNTIGSLSGIKENVQ